jgi:DNA-binding PadR family transcriptional regulator
MFGHGPGFGPQDGFAPGGGHGRRRGGGWEGFAFAHGGHGPWRGLGGAMGHRAFGPGMGRMGWWGGGRRRQGRGDVRAAILALLWERPLHGYQIMQEIAERTAGAWTPSPGSVYPTLQQLEDEGLVAVEAVEGRRVYRLTEAGRAYAEERRQELASLWEGLEGMRDGDWVQVRALAWQTAMAAMQVAHAGDARQVAEAARLLAETRRRLYAILAEEGAPDGGEED